MELNKNEALQEWVKEVEDFSFPRWEDLPDIDLYMDQVLYLIEKYLYIFQTKEEKKIITSSMINNYVKLKMMPKPVKKRYTKKHLAYLIAITVLKQVLTISEIKKGLFFQADIDGIRGAYDLFCSEQEYALRAVVGRIVGKEQLSLMKEDTNSATIIVRNATLAVATKIGTEKMLSVLPKESHKEE